jgi:hypothetical protein
MGEQEQQQQGGLGKAGSAGWEDVDIDARGAAAADANGDGGAGAAGALPSVYDLHTRRRKAAFLLVCAVGTALVPICGELGGWLRVATGRKRNATRRDWTQTQHDKARQIVVLVVIEAARPFRPTPPFPAHRRRCGREPSRPRGGSTSTRPDRALNPARAPDTIYLPALEAVRRDLGTTADLVATSVAVYMCGP